LETQQDEELDKLIADYCPKPIPEHINQLTGQVVDAAINIHKAIGPGLLESAYEICMTRELSKRNIKFRTQVTMPIDYDGIKLDAGYRLDILVEEQVIVELKSVEKLTPLHKSQLLTYLKFSKCRVGLLINFNTRRLADEIIRCVR